MRMVPCAGRRRGRNFFPFSKCGKVEGAEESSGFFQKCDFSLSLSLSLRFFSRVGATSIEVGFLGREGGRKRGEVEEGVGFKVGHFSVVPLDVHGECVRTYGHGRTNEIELESGELP